MPEESPPEITAPLVPPNDRWPVRNSYGRPGCYALQVSCWRFEVPPIGPREAFDPLWDELISWLDQCPALTDIETHWVHDRENGWQLLVTGLAMNISERVKDARELGFPDVPLTEREAEQVRGCRFLEWMDDDQLYKTRVHHTRDNRYYILVDEIITYEEQPPASIEDEPISAPAPRRRLNPALLGALAMMTLGMDLTQVSEPEEREPDEDDAPEALRYAFRQQSVQANYTALMPDGSLDMVYSEPRTPLEIAVVKHWDPFAQRVYRREQRVNRKQRAARKRKRGWA